MKYENKSLEAKSASWFFLMCKAAAGGRSQMRRGGGEQANEREEREREGWEVLAVLLRGTEE